MMTTKFCLLIMFVLLQSPTPEPYHGEPIPELITVRNYSAPFGCPQLGDPHKINGYYYEDPSYDGTCWQKNYFWNPGVPTYESQFLVMPELTIGSAYAYDANLMEHTALYHELNTDNVIDGVALPFCSEIGGYVWLMRTSVGVWEGPFRVVDCAGLLDLYNVVVHRHEVVEVGFKTAVKWGMVGDIQKSGESWTKKWNYRKVNSVIVSKVNPNNLGIISPRNLSDWFRQRVTFFRTQSEWDNVYKPIHKTVDQVKYWRFEKNGQWMKFNNRINR